MFLDDSAPVQLVPEHAIVEVRRIPHHVLRVLLPGQQPPLSDVLLLREHRAVHPVKVRYHHITVIFLSGVNQTFRGVPGQPVVAVHELQIFPRRHSDGLIPAVRDPGVGLVNDVEPLVHLLVLPADLEGGIRASVVDNDYLHIPKSLLHGAVETAAEIFFGIVRGNYQ